MDAAILGEALTHSFQAEAWLNEIILDWRKELWPDARKDPIFKENKAAGVRDWREMEVPKPFARIKPMIENFAKGMAEVGKTMTKFQEAFDAENSPEEDCGL